MSPAIPTSEILVQLALLVPVAGAVLIGFALAARALMGSEHDDRVERAGYRAPWKLALMGARAPVMPVKAQLLLIALVVGIGLVALAARLF